MELLKLKAAAKLISISYPTLKQWIYQAKISSVKTPGGHHRIPRSEIDRLTETKETKALKQRKPVGLRAISGRNKLLGTVTGLQFDGLLAQVTVDVGGQEVTSIITRGSCQELGIRKGVRVFALIKATEVMIIRG
ncbi:MAG: TOBE domain-containing protein [Acidobacteria bacterium]|nr:TOBE domain-containing protein [Acidobacteriota bacterium]MBI3656966.1 TOBE domain-containing protein [Acidobacteriota bacterium]